MFDSIPISTLLLSEVEAVSLTGVFQQRDSIDEKHGMFYIVLLAEFDKEYVDENVNFR